MLRTERDPIKKEVKRLDSLPKESPFGDTSTKKKSKKKKVKEVLLFPEKSSLDSPKKSKLKKASPEVQKMSGQLSNIIKVPQSQLDTFMSVYDSTSSNISTEFLKSIAPAFLAFEDAMNYSSVALRDGLSYDGEIDLELLPLLEWAARLNTFELFLKCLPTLSESVKSRLLRLATVKAVDKAFGTKPNSGNLNTNNKVAGILTTLDTAAQNKIKQAVRSVQSLKQAATKTKLHQEKNSTVPGVVLKRRPRHGS